jgi:hypothetical protein
VAGVAIARVDAARRRDHHLMVSQQAVVSAAPMSASMM